MSGQITLAIESAISGGSLALARDGTIIAEWEGDSEDLRSEELLARISEIMASSRISVRDLTGIAVSNGPGSYTGIRVGIATAIGLAASRGIRCSGISVMNSIARSDSRDNERVVAVPIGRGNYCWRMFSGPGSSLNPGEILIGSLNELCEFVASNPGIEVLAHSEAFQAISARYAAENGLNNLFDIGRNLAKCIARDSASIDEGLEPFYAREVRVGGPVGKQ